MSRYPGMLNTQWGRLRVLSEAGRSTSGAVLWRCLCVCGATKIVSGGNLRGGNTQSCGCLSRDLNRFLRTTHGHGSQKQRNRTYLSWTGMIGRCYNRNNHAYLRYGGRGVVVCDRWRVDFANFLADMGERQAGYSLDRINNDGNYEPSNCRWATPREQNAPGRRCHPMSAYARKTIADLKHLVAELEHEIEVLVQGKVVKK